VQFTAARGEAAVLVSKIYRFSAAAERSSLHVLDVVVSTIRFSEETPRMIIIIHLLAWSILLYSVQGVPVFGQGIVLPQGDPQSKETKEDPAIEGTLQGGRSESTAGDRGTVRQDTGIEDPTVNPGQASGMQSIQGRIIKSDGDTHIIRQLGGPDATLTVDDHTAGDKKLHPGDVVTGLITPQGRAVAIHKEASAKQ
jgi:hypothetical protein